VPGYEASFWNGIAGPKGLRPEIVDTLNKSVNAGLEDPQVKARLAEWAPPGWQAHLPISPSSSSMNGEMG
jgi:tripartite-type tricarboxylate transporter receptor subunit TctC